MHTKTSMKSSQRVRWNVMVCSKGDTTQGFPCHRVAHQKASTFLSESSKKSLSKEKLSMKKAFITGTTQTLSSLSVQLVVSILPRFEFASVAAVYARTKRKGK